MIVVNYLAAGALLSLGLFIVLTRRNLIKIIMGLSLIESSSYLLLISMAYRRGSTAPVLLNPQHGETVAQLVKGNVADPVLQNFCLTAIVIGVAVTAVFLTIAVRVSQHYQSLDSDRMREIRG